MVITTYNICETCVVTFLVSDLDLSDIWQGLFIQMHTVQTFVTTTLGYVLKVRTLLDLDSLVNTIKRAYVITWKRKKKSSF